MIRIHGYKTGKLIAVGGTAEVFEGIKESDGSRVAIKVLNETYSSDPVIKQRLLREAHIIGQNEHRGLVRIFRYGTQNNRLYMVMEYMGGGSLENYRELSRRFRLKTMLQICDGIRFIHNKGIIHRDLKPSNILFGDDGLPRLVDFGISLFRNEDFTRLTHTHLVMGTLAYMSPEQQNAPQHVDHRSDIYSLGVILYELFTHQKPTGRFKDPSELVPSFPTNLEKCILKCLEEDPKDRYQEVGQLQQDLIELWESGLFDDGSEESSIPRSFDDRIGIWIQHWERGTSKEKMIAKEHFMENVQQQDTARLMELALKGNDNLRLLIFPAFGKLSSKKAVDLLIQYLGNPLFTRDICEALGSIGDASVLPSLIKLAKMGNAFSDSALMPIAKLGEEKHLKHILPYLKHRRFSERKAAVLALDTPKAKRYLKDLKKAMKKETETEIRNKLYALINRLELL